MYKVDDDMRRNV